MHAATSIAPAFPYVREGGASAPDEIELMGLSVQMVWFIIDNTFQKTATP